MSLLISQDPWVTFGFWFCCQISSRDSHVQNLYLSLLDGEAGRVRYLGGGDFVPQLLHQVALEKS